MPGGSRSLPGRPSLRYLKLEAKRRVAAGEFPSLHEAQVAIAREHERMALREDRFQSLGDPFAKIIEPMERRRAAPRHEDHDGAFAAVEIEPFERGFDGRGDGSGIDFLFAQRQRRRDDRHVPQRQRA